MALYTGATVEEAIKNGLEDLGLPRMKVRIKVLAREKSGFLGLGKKMAQVEMEALTFTDYDDLEDTTPLPASLVEALEEDVSAESQSQEDMTEAISKLAETGKLSILFPRDLSKEDLVEEQKETLVEASELEEVIETTSPQASEPLVEVETVEPDTGETELEADFLETPVALEEAEVSEPVVQDFLKADLVEATESEVGSELVQGVRRERDSLEEEQMDQAQSYLEVILKEMDVEASVSASISRRTIYFQIDTNEPGRVIGYHGKVLKSLQLLAQNYLYNLYGRTLFISINVNDYVEHRAEVLQSYAQKLALRVLEEGRAMETDPMSNSERKIIHRIISKIDGVTSYSEGDEPNRYVVVDVEEERELV
ncbi:Jag N-terminal domain-containing protein [Streptococcus danieliae]|nr:Jag N-terminal domain-containing protein [Streptococcus danieliae]